MHPARSSTLRRWFFAALMLAAAVIVLTRFLVFPDTEEAADWSRTLGATLDNLLAATITSLAIGLAYVLLLPAPEAESVDVTQPREIAGLLESAAKDCTFWAIRSRTASYFARVTLPQLRDNALRTGGSIRVRIQLLDPTNDRALQAYATFRSNRPGASAIWNVARVRLEIYSTILAAAVHQNEAPRLDVEVGLSQDFWILSLDLSDKIAIITGQNKGEPCLCIRHTSPLFSGWRDDFDAGFSVCRVIRPAISGLRMQELHRPSARALDSIRIFFDQLGFPNLDDPSLRKIADYAGREHNYA
ncbi:hypothetical protein OHA72_47640 [Dactylosporangium sp. NBC_01737]|uniref:hypothetical protein n=1 Tax=Dactylosporangium sp. NBC_01737 TaxID=2975959 RepID=UPI002E121535|nr:hypothetical protein OHA72_47640 [Dactylosporangium sp. NBC_01737]